jgi:hypothetical protein
MAASSRAAALSEFRHSLQRAISCVTRAVVHSDRADASSPELQTLTIANGDAVALSGLGELSLALAVYFHMERDRTQGLWMVVVVGYLFSVEDRSGRFVIAYHWHTTGRSRVAFPHFHLGPAAQVGQPHLEGAHFPTGHITANDVVRLLIMDLGVEPLRRDWERVLAVPLVT